VIRTYTFTEAGGHPANEDVLLVRHSPGEPEGCLVWVADGQGGRAGGAKAARLACDAAASHAGNADDWPDMLAQADRAVAADPEAGFTTLLGFAVWGDTLLGASCGDSAVLAVCGSGEITELTRLQYKNPPVGSGEAVFMPFEAELVRPWKVLAMTDGVWKYVGWQRVRELATTLGDEELLAALQSAARMPGNGQFQDDFTVVLVEAD
jgi:serine/threonine protein phosphatase PrpC